MSQTTIIYPAGQMPSGVICGPTTGCGKMIPFRRVDGLQFMACSEGNAAPLDAWETPDVCPHCGQWCGKQTAAVPRATPSAGGGKDEARLRYPSQGKFRWLGCPRCTPMGAVANTGYASGTEPVTPTREAASTKREEALAALERIELTLRRYGSTPTSPNIRAVETIRAALTAEGPAS